MALLCKLKATIELVYVRAVGGSSGISWVAGKELHFRYNMFKAELCPGHWG